MNDNHFPDAKKAQREYMREWRSKNPDKVRAAQIRYWQRKAEQRQKEVNNNGRN